MTEKPNIVILFNDHQCYYAHGETVGGPKIQRPFFEQLAAEGIEFTRSYTACPLCGPARRSLLTGLYPHNHLELLNEMNHPYDRELYFSCLEEVGYKNYYFGKWHAGSGTALDIGCEGFSCPGYGNPYITPEYEVYLKRMGLPRFEVDIKHMFFNPKWPITKEFGIEIGKPFTPTAKNYHEHAIGLMTTPKETHEAFFLANLACEQLNRIAESGNSEPFHLRVDFWGPHHPYYTTEEFLKRYNPNDIPELPSFNENLSTKPRIYSLDANYPISKNGILIQPNPLPWEVWQQVLAYKYAQTTLIDEAGGLVLNALKRLGLDKNTLIIWTTDHGDAVGSHGGHFDKDCYMPEVMIRVPFAMKYPGVIKANQKSSGFTSTMDIAPTILEAAGTTFSNPVDGNSLFSLISDNKSDWRKSLMVETHGHFHLHLGRTIITDEYKYVYNEGDMDELYDLREDPFELNNLINSRSQEHIIKSLKDQLNEWRNKTNDSMTKRMIRKSIR